MSCAPTQTTRVLGTQIEANVAGSVGKTQYRQWHAIRWPSEQCFLVQDAEDIDSDDDKNRVYMCRHEYMAEKEQWKDMEVPVFCICDLPYNPDLNMVHCSGCGEWYDAYRPMFPAVILR
jgi:hypothetical protein